MRTFSGRFAARLRARLRSEAGFTLIELMSAIGVILVALLAMAYVATIGFSDIALARQRESANGLANQALEQIRGLPFSTLAKGLANNDLAGDANIVLNGGCGTPTVYCYGGESIPRGNNPNVVPLVPHKNTIVVGQTTYTVAAYVTYYNNVTTSNTFRVTVVVNWTNVARRGVSHTVQVQTVAYSGTGCLSTITHPFAAPCQPFFYSSSSAAQGHFDISGDIDGVALSSASALLPGESSNIQIEQISAVQGISTVSSASITLDGQAAQTTGGAQLTSGADNDPAQPGQDYNTVNLTSSAVPIIVTSGGGGNSNGLTLTPSTGDPATSTSTTSASLANPAHLCPLTGLAQNDQQPCGKSTVQQSSTASAVLVLRKQLDLGTTTLFSIAAQPSVGYAFANRDLQSGVDGLLHSDMARSLGTVTLGALPTGLPVSAVPVGWAGYLVQITGFSDTVSAETGTGTAAPSVIAIGTLKYWTGAGYSTLVLAPGAGLNLPVASVHILTIISGQLLQVDMQASTSSDCNVWVQGCPRTGGTSTSSTALTCTPTPCPNTRTAASATSNSPFIGDVHYTISYNGTVLADLTTHLDLGTLLAQNTYQVAPSAQ
jgi:type II secretory pathway pseudopilin PulG